MPRIEFSGLYDRYAAEVMRFALYLTGDASEAEEITSETFVRAWLASGDIRADSVKAYLLTIARNLHVQRYRAQVRQRELSPDLAGAGAGPEQCAADRDELRSVLRALQAMPEADRAAVLMRANDVSYESIAEALGVSAAAARVKVHRARMKLIALGLRS